MKHAMHKWLPVALIALVATAACDETPVDLPAATEIAAAPAAVQVFVGESAQLSANVLDQDGQAMDRDVSWTSLNPGIATVSSGGVVTGRAPGEASIVASHGSIQSTITVTVVSEEMTFVVARDELELEVGDAHSLVAELRDRADNSVGFNTNDIIWTSSDNVVATVNGNGVVFAQNVGEAEITAEYRGQVETVTVTVVEDVDENEDPRFDIESISFSEDAPETLEVDAGDQFVEFEAYDELGNLACDAVVMESSNPTVLDVFDAGMSPDGLCEVEFDPQFVGTAEAILRNEDGSVEARMEVTVEDIDYSAQFEAEEDPSHAGGTGTYSVTVTDQDGNPVEGVEFFFTTDLGSLSETTVTTDENGVATTEWTYHTNVNFRGTQARLRIDAEDIPGVFEGFGGIFVENVQPAMVDQLSWFRWDDDEGEWTAVTGSPAVETGETEEFALIGFDEFGNLLDTDLAGAMCEGDEVVGQGSNGNGHTVGDRTVFPAFCEVFSATEVESEITMEGVVDHQELPADEDEEFQDESLTVRFVDPS